MDASINKCQFGEDYIKPSDRCSLQGVKMGYAPGKGVNLVPVWLCTDHNEWLTKAIAEVNDMDFYLKTGRPNLIHQQKADS